MKKSLILFLFFIMAAPAFSMDDSSYMSLEEYSRFFEMGLIGEHLEDEEETVEEFTPKLKEKLDLDGSEIISLEQTPLKLRIEQTALQNPYRQTAEIPTSGVELIKTEKFTFFSDAKKELSDYMTDNLKSTMNVSYKLSDKLTLRAGHEIWYVNPNASIGAKKIYFNPRLNLTERCYLDYAGKYNRTSKNTEQEIGINYRPKLFRDSASFGVKASATTNQNNEIQSRKLKFTSDIYIF